MKSIDEIRRINLSSLAKKEGGVTSLADKMGVKHAQMSAWINGSKDSKTGKPRGIRSESCREIEERLGLPMNWMDNDHSESVTIIEGGVEIADEANGPYFEIEYVDARGSCGGGYVNWDVSKKAPLRKETTWFSFYGVRPKDVIALRAHGDSMLPDFSDATFKRYRERGGLDEHGNPLFELVPLNPNHGTLLSDRDRCKVLGVMIEHRIKY